MIRWQRPLVFTHRWLGIALGLLFAAWFGSGLVMVYARMPELTPAERRARLPPLDLAAIRLSPADAAARHHLAGVERVRVAMLGVRPVYRFTTHDASVIVFADTGDRFAAATAEDALGIVRRFAPDCMPRGEARIDEPDQWTLETRAQLPMYRVACDDARVYVSERSGEVVVMTTARARRIAYAGAVLHWLYFTPLRKHGALWANVVIAASAAGTVLCALGLVWGAYQGLRSPYRGWMRWHHYAGLIFGVFSLTWVFSGFLSMDPLDWHAPTAPTRAQREAFAGELRLEDLGRSAEAFALLANETERGGLSSDRSAKALAERELKEIEITAFHGQPLIAIDGASAASIDQSALVAAARDALPDAPLEEVAALEDYDAYYYDRARTLPLPALRVRFADPARTWLYVDPARGAILRVETRSSRLNRWLYHGLHSLDFPWLYRRRPLWDLVVIALSLGGLASAITAAVPAWARLRRLVTRLMADS